MRPLPCKREIHAKTGDKKMGQKYTIKFKVTDLTAIQNDEVDLERYFEDLLTSSILPALGMELNALSLEVKKARK
jgi:hypothetical protein